jgi:signal peptidase II
VPTLRGRRRRTGLKDMRRWTYLFLSVLVFAADQLTKGLIQEGMHPGQVHRVASWFSIVYWENTGGLWGFFQHVARPVSLALFYLLPAVGVGFLIYLFLKARSRFDLVLICFILGGAAGNILDRLRLGHVVDFLYFHIPGGPGWPAFNIADAFLSVSILILLYRTMRPERPAEAAGPEKTPRR